MSLFLQTIAFLLQVIEHNDDGSLAVILNSPLNPLNDSGNAQNKQIDLRSATSRRNISIILFSKKLSNILLECLVRKMLQKRFQSS